MNYTEYKIYLIKNASCVESEKTCSRRIAMRPHEAGKVKLSWRKETTFFTWWMYFEGRFSHVTYLIVSLLAPFLFTLLWLIAIETSAKLNFAHSSLSILQVRYDPCSHVESPKCQHLKKRVAHTFEPNHNVSQYVNDLMCKLGPISYVQSIVSMCVFMDFIYLVI